MDHRLRGGVVVTGASTGIGRAAAIRLARRGFSVFGGVRRDEDAERLRAGTGGRVTPVRLDVTDADQIASARDAVERALEGERLAGVVNNAGIGVGGSLEFVSLEDLRRQFDVNVVGPVAVAQSFLPMLRSSRGRIVHVGSVSGLMSAPFVGPYSASKGALEAIAAAMRMELAPWGIGVSIVDPGDVDSAIWGKTLRQIDEMSRSFSADAMGLYGAMAPKVRRYFEGAAAHAMPTDDAARAIERALTERKPKARYVVGRRARAQAVLARTLPLAALEAITVRAMGL